MSHVAKILHALEEQVDATMNVGTKVLTKEIFVIWIFAILKEALLHERNKQGIPRTQQHMAVDDTVPIGRKGLRV